jgi:hypothetical protein
MKIIKIEKNKNEYFIEYKIKNEIFTYYGNAEECLKELKGILDD